jgi:methyl-accepting chemotaxis protein
VEEQSATASEVARSISNVSQATEELARNVQQASAASEEVARRSLALEEASQQTALVGSQTRIGIDAIKDVVKLLETIMSGFKINEARFDISKIKTAHMGWVKRLQSVLSGELYLKPEEVTAHTECDFGKWYFSPAGRSMGTLPAYVEVGLYHEQVHTHAREIVRLYGNKQYVEARNKMSEFEVARNKLFSRLNDLYCA